MLIQTFQGAPIRLITEVPDWRAGRIEARLTLPTSKIRGLTGREARTPLGSTLRVDMRWAATLFRHEMDDLRNGLQVDATDQDSPFVVPFWPAAMLASDAADSPIGSGLWVGWNSDGSGWTLTDDPLDLSGLEIAAPALRGRLEVEPEAIEVGILVVRFRFQEDSAAADALQLDPAVWDEGPALPDTTRPTVFPFPVVWLRSPQTGAAEVEVDRTVLGPGRAMASAYWPQSAERVQEGTASLLGLGELARFLRWFSDRRGDVDAHYVGTLLEVGRLVEDADPGDTSIVVDDPERIGSNAIALIFDGSCEEWVRIIGAAGPVLTLSAPLTGGWLAETSGLQLGMLARHARPEVEIQWDEPGVATAVIGWREVPAEISPAAGETRGTSLGRLPDVAWLYALTVDRGGGAPEVHRITSFERDLTADGQTWTAWPVEHTEIVQGIQLDREEVTLRLRYREPLSLFVPGRHDAVLRLAVYRCTVSGGAGSNVSRLFGGEAIGYRANGPICTVSFAGANALFGRRVPRFLMQRGCNYRLFEARCGLSLADWDLVAAVHSFSGNTVTLESFVPSSSVPVGWGGAHWFALGYLERSSGQRNLIVDSAAKDGSGRVLLTLHAPAVPPFSIGESVTVVPGCDGDIATCDTKFGNLSRHGGFPWIPDKNPAFQPLRKTTGAGKK